MKLTHLGEPLLEFGGAFRHVDIRFGIMDYGPFDLGMDAAPTRIRLGIVGSAETVEGTANGSSDVARVFPQRRVASPTYSPPSRARVSRRRLDASF